MTDKLDFAGALNKLETKGRVSVLGSDFSFTTQECETIHIALTVLDKMQRGEINEAFRNIENYADEIQIICNSAHNEKTENIFYFKEQLVGAALRAKVIRQSIDTISKAVAAQMIKEACDE